MDTKLKHLTVKCQDKVFVVDNERPLLDQLQEHKLPISRGCSAGICSMCKVVIKHGEVNYTRQPIAALSRNEILTCISQIREDIEIVEIL